MATPRRHVLLGHMESMLTRREHGTQIKILAATIHSVGVVAVTEEFS